ncbi:uncharacterized protein LOC125232247 [Leguminivora glycinivorella]|uniref:uncharacterized protein LOC125232247 n=1 Tax=Leguminivora glycinivorella TaxID=1035111 RepID=UPI00200DFF1A|nr:uncharacterized protein LOC125232247 [Leguminivora glycinivorella]
MALTIDETNALIKNQEDNYEEIRRIWENIKQDSTARKTQKYVDERKSNLDSIYQRAFDRRLQEQEVLSSHKYLTLNHKISTSEWKNVTRHAFRGSHTKPSKMGLDDEATTTTTTTRVRRAKQDRKIQ